MNVIEDCPNCKNIHSLIKLAKGKYKCPSCLSLFFKFEDKIIELT